MESELKNSDRRNAQRHESSKRKKEKKDKKRKHKKHKQHKQHRAKKSKLDTRLSSSSDSETDLLKEQESSVSCRVDNDVDRKKDDGNISLCLERDDWMTTNSLFLSTYCKSKKIENDKSKTDVYDPQKSSRELNPYWKAGDHSGLPFQKPIDEEFPVLRRQPQKCNNFDFKAHHQRNLNWKKNKIEIRTENENRVKEDLQDGVSKMQNKIDDNSTEIYLNDQEMNALGAKLIKAEIMGNIELATNLRQQLEKSRAQRNNSKCTNDKDFNEKHVSNHSLNQQQYSERKQNQRFTSRFREQSDFNILSKFKPEKQITQKQLEMEYDEFTIEQSSKTVTDLFESNMKKKISKISGETNYRTMNIDNKSLMNCDKCLESDKMNKNLMVSMGSNCYLTLPWYEGLQPGHCLIVPIQHVSCSTELDDDVWLEITNFRKSLTKMFYKRNMSVVFFELAKYINQRSHMVIHCIASKNLDLAPFYFKKAIEESENEWSTNKQLISLKDKNLIKSIPKGLPYFWVHFGMENGFAHVIENQEKFPMNFAQEIIGNILNLNPQMWRKLRKENNLVQKVKQLANWWKDYDCTSAY